jgi:xanthine dehydrogenase accessory factor
VYCELPGREKRLVVCGGGHVSIPVIRIARMLGLAVTVLEDRPAFAENARRAGAERVICAPFDEGLGQIPGDGDTFFVIVTRGHGSDLACLEAISRKPHAYIGMIGSRRRVALVKACLVDERGCDPAVIGAVHMPIGLDIAAQTPEEIAVAIMAEIIGVKNRGGRNAVWPRELLQAILDPAADGPRALATVVERRGSAPRGAGARMLVWPDGKALGTVGGGLLESEVIQAARGRLLAGDTAPCLHRAALDAGLAAGDGMACGGEVTLLIEIIGDERGPRVK